MRDELSAMDARIWSAFEAMVAQDHPANVEQLKRYYMAGMTNTINEALKILEAARGEKHENG